MKKISLILIIFTLLLSVQEDISAHQPRIVSGEEVIRIDNPEVSQAFYGELMGKPVYYQIEEDSGFNLYVGILSPQIENAEKDFSVEVRRGEEIIFILDGPNQEWESFYEEFGGDYYYEGPENKMYVDPGAHNLKVFSPDNRGKYVLVVGEKEEFPLGEILNTVKILPELKKDFFEKSSFTAFFNIVGLFIFGPVIIMLIIILSVFLYRKRRARK